MIYKSLVPYLILNDANTLEGVFAFFMDHFPL